MHKKISITHNFIFRVLLLIFIFLSTNAFGETSSALSIPDITVKIGQPVILPVKVNKVTKLAGIKLVIKYDANLLVYVESKKTDISKSFMHVVNDKKPGELIIVMASAKGITAENAPIFTIQFKIKNNLDKKVSSIISIAEGELMDENLKAIAFNPIAANITIIP